jgi:GT2 family glycosyltransferase
MLVRSVAVKTVGFLDERYFMYAEDKEYCVRMRAAGYRTVVCHQARVRHMGGRSTSRDPLRMEEIAHTSRARFFLTTYGTWMKSSIYLWLTIWTVVTMVQYCVMRKPNLALASAKGFVGGLKSARYLRA